MSWRAPRGSCKEPRSSAHASWTHSWCAHMSWKQFCYFAGYGLLCAKNGTDLPKSSWNFVTYSKVLSLLYWVLWHFIYQKLTDQCMYLLHVGYRLCIDHCRAASPVATWLTDATILHTGKGLVKLERSRDTPSHQTQSIAGLHQQAATRNAGSPVQSVACFSSAAWGSQEKGAHSHQ